MFYVGRSTLKEGLLNPRCGSDAAGKKEIASGLLGFVDLDVLPNGLTPFISSLFEVCFGSHRENWKE